ncbi:MAG: hypothetical protein ACK55I_06760, partial [bacterium]
RRLTRSEAVGEAHHDGTRGGTVRHALGERRSNLASRERRGVQAIKEVLVLGAGSDTHKVVLVIRRMRHDARTLGVQLLGSSELSLRGGELEVSTLDGLAGSLLRHQVEAVHAGTRAITQVADDGIRFHLATPTATLRVGLHERVLLGTP